MTSFREFVEKMAKDRAGVAVGLSPVPGWISTGCWALDWRISGRFGCGIPFGRLTMFAGESGAGKSLLVSGYVVRHALDAGAQVLLVDTENAIDPTWLRRLEIDPDHPALQRVEVGVIEELLGFLGRVFRGWHEAYGDKPFHERPKLLVVIDSLGMMLTRGEAEGLDRGETSDDRGRRAKALNVLMRAAVDGARRTGAALVVTNHVYQSQSLYATEPAVAGGHAARYGPSVRILVRRAKLRASDLEDGDGGTTGIAGVRIVATVEKTRFHKEYEKVEIRVPWKGGLDPFCGIATVLQEIGELVPEGRKLVWTDPETGESVKLWAKEWEANHEGWTLRVIESVRQRMSDTPTGN